MNRRAFLSAISGGLLAAPLAVEAQQAAKIARIGLLGNDPVGGAHHIPDASCATRFWEVHAMQVPRPIHTKRAAGLLVAPSGIARGYRA